MKIHRNYCDPRFCPVLWLIILLFYQGMTEGPIFQSETGEGFAPAQWQTALKHLFTAASLYTPASNGQRGHGCTSHSIRRSAAQWASRCGGRDSDVRNTGRWKGLKHLLRYLAQGAMTREDYEDDEVEDPIFSMWVYKRTCSSRVGSRDMI